MYGKRRLPRDCVSNSCLPVSVPEKWERGRPQYAEGGGGRPAPWVYGDDGGNYHWTAGNPAQEAYKIQHFLKSRHDAKWTYVFVNCLQLKKNRIIIFVAYTQFCGKVFFYLLFQQKRIHHFPHGLVCSIKLQKFHAEKWTLYYERTA